jgi:hypothetical protein
VLLRNVGKHALGLFTAVGLASLAVGASGCLSDDTSLSPVPRDAGLFDAGNLPPVFDASGSVDGTSPSPVDAGTDATVPDAGVPDAGTDAGSDAGKDAAVVPSQAGLVAGGAVGHSPGYKMTGTTGPATAPVLTSPKYKLVGGVSVTGHKP